jgi:hypothetical protein
LLAEWNEKKGWGIAKQFKARKFIEVTNKIKCKKCGWPLIKEIDGTEFCLFCQIETKRVSPKKRIDKNEG